jgi:predicted N-acyltransferase
MVRPGCAAELRARVELALVEHVEALARSGGRTLCFRGLPAGSTLGALIGQRGYLRGREMPSSYLDLHFGSFAEYRRSLRSTHARIYKVLAQERNRGRRHGLVIGAVDDPRPLREELHRLLDEHWRRLNGRPFPYHAGFLERVKANLGERATISTARIGTEVVGVAVLLHAPAAMYVPIVGMDPRRGRPSSAYFNLVYNHPIEQGIQTGTPRLHMGKMQYLVKRRRGCRLLELDFHLRPRNRLQAMALRGLLPLRSRRIERLVEEA